MLAWVATKERTPLYEMLPWLVLGGLLSLPGVIPAVLLNGNVDPETVRRANEIYVFQRLKHHLVMHTFARERQLAFLAMLGVWLAISFAARGSTKLAALRRFVLGTVMIAIVGMVIDQTTLEYPQVGAALLRFYWYRLADVMVPLGLAMALAEAAFLWEARRPGLSRAYLALLVLLAMGVLGVRYGRQMLDGRSGADIQGHIGNENREQLRQWQLVCAWARHDTQPGDRFLTPPLATTFRWYAQRSEVVGWKDIPQSAVGVVQWARRLRETQRFWAALARDGYTRAASERLLQMAQRERYGFRYVIVPASHGAGRLPLPEVFRSDWEEPEYVVYRVYPVFPGGR
jgi:hypothetical protein